MSPRFVAGESRTRESGRRGGRVSAEARRGRVGRYTGSILDLMNAVGVTGPTWEPWRSLLRCTFALPQGDEDRKFFTAHTGRTQTPTAPVSECWIVAGRRGGKSRMAALVALFKAMTFDASRLAPGELAVVPIISADRKQARVTLAYLRGMCGNPVVAPYVHRVLKEGGELRTGVNVEVQTASYRTIRGYTVISAVLDEVAFWRDEATSANPDSEILDALRPGMATIADAVLFAISSPYARKGELHATYERYFGQDNPHVLVWNADARSLNPSVPEHVIERAYAEDPLAAASEYGREGKVEFRRDVEAFLEAEAIRAVTVPDRRELPRLAGVRYVGFLDPSGGSQDAFTVAIAHREGSDRAVLDCTRERRPPFSPDAVVEEYATLLKAYGVQTVTGDRYAGEWPREAFARHGIQYVATDHTKSDLYRELLAPINAGRVELLDLPVLRTQFVGLERRVARGGKDSIDHAPGGKDDVANAAAGALVNVLPKVSGKKLASFV